MRRFIGMPIGIARFREGANDFITSTNILRKPVDYALAGEQLIKDRYREWEIPAYRKTETAHTMRSGAARLSKNKSSFSTRSGSLGGSHRD